MKDYRPKPSAPYLLKAGATWHEVLDAAAGFLMFHSGDAAPRRASREQFCTAANYLDDLAAQGYAAAIRPDGRTWRECVDELEAGMRDDFASAFSSGPTGGVQSTKGSEAVERMAQILDDYIAEHGAE